MPKIERKCENCKWCVNAFTIAKNCFRTGNPEKRFYECRRFPDWKKVELYHFCGEFRPKTNPKKK